MRAVHGEKWNNKKGVEEEEDEGGM